MTKSNRLYKIFMTTMIVIIAGMLLATGIIAIQKSMKLNVSMSMLPTADIEILVGGAESETLLFRNFDKDTNNKVYVDTSKATLSGNTFSLKDSFVNTCGSEFTIIVKNYSNFPIKVGLSSTATVEGVENATGIPATITPASQSLAACSSYTSPTSAEFSVTIEAVMTQTTNLTIVISEVSIATLKTGADVKTAIGTDSTSVVFDYWSAEYETSVGDWLSGTAIDVDNAGKIKLFSVDTARYILSESEIYANASCQNMFTGCASLANITFNNFNTSNVSNMIAMFALCTSLKTLDLSSFETVQNPISITNMFNNCTSLETVYVHDEKWDSNKVSGSGVFANAAAIKGGAGTTYDSNNVTAYYARIDAPSTPGYFTDIADKSSKFTVIYDANGGSGTMANQKISVGVSTALTTNTFTYEGYTFEGWSTSASGTVVYTDGQSVTNLASAGQTITLYAVWEADTPVVSYATLKTGADVKTAIGTDSTSVVFDYWSAEYETIVGDWSSGTAIDVDDAGKIKLFSVDTARYILSESEMYANANCGGMFQGCSNITNIEFNNFNTSQVTTMVGMFHGCSSLIDLNLSSFDTSNVTVMTQMFFNCANLQTLDISNFTSNENGCAVGTISVNGTYTHLCMFVNCTSLTTIYSNGSWDVNNFRAIQAAGTDLETLKSQGNTIFMFYNCPNLEGGAGTTYTLTADCSTYEYAKIDGGIESPGYFTDIADKSSKFTVIYDANGGDGTMANQKISVGVSTALTTNTFTYEGYTFEGWSTSASGTVVYTDGQSVTNLASAGQTITLYAVWEADTPVVSYATLKTGPDVKTAIGTDSTSVVFDYWSAEYETIVGNWSSGTAIDVDDAGKIKLFSVDTARYILSESEIYANASCQNMFAGCASLANITFNNFNTSNVTTMASMFGNCQVLTNLDVSGFNTTNVTAMSAMFAQCTSLKSIDLSNFNTSKVTVMVGMFASCSGLTSLNLSNFNTSNVTTMQAMFYNCQALTVLDLSSFTTNVNGVTIGCSSQAPNMGMFEKCSSLTTIYVSEKWDQTKLATNYALNVFLECTNLVGGNGTAFSEVVNNTIIYACIDTPSTPGYFTDIAFKDAPTLTLNFSLDDNPGNPELIPDDADLSFVVVITNDDSFNVMRDPYGKAIWTATGLDGDVENSGEGGYYLYSKTGDVYLGYELNTGIGKSLGDVELSSDYKYIEWINDIKSLEETKTFSVPVGYYVWVFSTTTTNGNNIWLDFDADDAYIEQSIYCLTQNGDVTTNIFGYYGAGV